MTLLALKGEVSMNKKMSTQISPRLGRSNIVLNSFGSCISNASKEFSWAPKMSFWKNLSQPRMFMQKFVSGISLKQLQCHANTHCRRHFNKQVNVVNSNLQLINFESMPISCLPDEKLAIHPDTIKLQGISCVFNFPDKMESILSEAMFKTFQIHFFAPKLTKNIIAHANFFSLVHGDSINPLDINKHQELNLVEQGNSSFGLKAEVSLPSM